MSLFDTQIIIKLTAFIILHPPRHTTLLCFCCMVNAVSFAANSSTSINSTIQLSALPLYIKESITHFDRLERASTRLLAIYPIPMAVTLRGH